MTRRQAKANSEGSSRQASQEQAPGDLGSGGPGAAAPRKDAVPEAFLAALLSPQHKGGNSSAAAAQPLLGKQPAGPARGNSSPMSGQAAAVVGSSREHQPVVVASTYSSRLVQVPTTRGVECHLEARDYRDQFTLEWFQREVTFFRSQNSESLLALQRETSSTEQPGRIRFLTEPVVESVDARIRKAGPFSPLQARVLLSESLKALEVLHKQGKLHGELNASRLLYVDGDRLVLFGSPGFRPEEELRPLSSGDLLAAPELLNPEEFGKLSKASDLYCLGHIVLYALLGQRYFNLLKVRNSETPRQSECLSWHGSSADRLPDLAELLPDAPPTLVTVLTTLTAKAPEDRYQSTSEAFADLHARFGKNKKGDLEKRNQPADKEASAIASLIPHLRSAIAAPPLSDANETAGESRGWQSKRSAYALIAAAATLVLGMLISMAWPSASEAPATADAGMESQSETPDEPEVPADGAPTGDEQIDNFANPDIDSDQSPQTVDVNSDDDTYATGQTPGSPPVDEFRADEDSEREETMDGNGATPDEEADETSANQADETTSAANASYGVDTETAPEPTPRGTQRKFLFSVSPEKIPDLELEPSQESLYKNVSLIRLTFYREQSNEVTAEYAIELDQDPASGESTQALLETLTKKSGLQLRGADWKYEDVSPREHHLTAPISLEKSLLSDTFFAHDFRELLSKPPLNAMAAKESESGRTFLRELREAIEVKHSLVSFSSKKAVNQQVEQAYLTVSRVDYSGQSEQLRNCRGEILNYLGKARSELNAAQSGAKREWHDIWIKTEDECRKLITEAETKLGQATEGEGTAIAANESRR